ncbi:Hypothetical_protein [Hexamita inflata]|uniref:Hypothetical_protein n=1 Tax=Hexamita inflata TaxID=28002 RepID=A0AA86NZE4_9EUKA|nr:Hypothetical protein HINF_LOCUS15234 [Hexamita inflata]
MLIIILYVIFAFVVLKFLFMACHMLNLKNNASIVSKPQKTYDQNWVKSYLESHFSNIGLSRHLDLQKMVLSSQNQIPLEQLILSHHFKRISVNMIRDAVKSSDQFVLMNNKLVIKNLFQKVDLKPLTLFFFAPEWFVKLYFEPVLILSKENELGECCEVVFGTAEKALKAFEQYGAEQIDEKKVRKCAKMSNPDKILDLLVVVKNLQ